MATAPEPGTILLDKYCVERVLGRGGMGFVVAVRHTSLNELFAMKLLRADLQSKAEAHERFLREARALARLRGEHAVRVQDVGTLPDGSPYMLMEHLQGKDLKQVVEERGPLPVEDVALYMMQACEAIAEAHEQGIIHRDLKPANLFLTTRPNGTPCVKVLDFGISKDTIAASPDLTRTNAFIGSPAYVSPERLANNRIANAQSDIWAIGIVLYELLDGRVPFRAKIITDLVAKILTTPHVPLNERRPGIPDEFEAIVQRCLEKRPERRYSSVRDIIYDLEPFATTQQRSKTNRQADAAPAFPKVEKTVVLPANSPALADEPTTIIPQPRPQLQSQLQAQLQPQLQPQIQPQPRALAARTDPMPQMPRLAPDVTPFPEMATGERMAQTTHGWGNTSDTLALKDKRPLILGGAALIAVLSVAILYVALSSSPDTNSETVTPSADTTQVSKTPAISAAPATTPPATIRVTPVGEAGPAENPPAPVPPGDTPNAGTSAKTAVPSTTNVKPRTTTKTKTIRGYDE